jgi:hypothetical protein
MRKQRDGRPLGTFAEIDAQVSRLTAAPELKELTKSRRHVICFCSPHLMKESNQVVERL